MPDPVLNDKRWSIDLEKRIREKEITLAASRCPFMTLQPVVRLMVDLATPRERRMFLVLDGPSRLGGRLMA